MPGPVYTAGRTPLASDIVDAGGVMQALRLLPPQPFASRTLAQPPAGPVPVAESVNTSTAATGGNAVFGVASSKVGNLLVMVLHMGTSTTTVTSVSDNLGGTWKKAGDNLASANYTAIWYLENCPAGINQVTAFLSASTSFNVNVTEWAGIALSGALRAANIATVTSSPNLSGSAVAVASDLAIGGIASNSGTVRYLATAGWTDLAFGAPVGGLTSRHAYKHSTGGTEEAQWNTTSVSNTGGVIAVFSRKPLLGQPTETDLAQPITALKTTPVGLVAEADSAMGITRTTPATIIAPVGQALETDSALAISRLKLHAANQAAETDSALAISRLKLHAANQAAETDTAQVVARVHRRTTGQVTEADTAQPLTHSKRRTVGQPTTTDAAQVVARRKLRTLAQPSTTDAAQPAAARKMRLLGQPSTAEAVQPVTRAAVGVRLAIGQALEADTAPPVTRIKRRAIGQPADQGTANPLVRTKTLVPGQAIETDTAAELLSAGPAPVVGRGTPRVTGATAAVGLGGVATAPTLATGTVAVGLEGHGRAAQVPRSEVRTR